MQTSSPRTGEFRLVSLIPRDAVPTTGPEAANPVLPQPVVETGYRGRHRRED